MTDKGKEKRETPLSYGSLSTRKHNSSAPNLSGCKTRRFSEGPLQYHRKIPRAAHDECNFEFQLRLNAKSAPIPIVFHNFQAMMGTSFSTTFSFTPLAFLIFLVSFQERIHFGSYGNCFLNHPSIALIFHLTQSVFVCVSVCEACGLLDSCLCRTNNCLPPYLCKCLPSGYLREGCRCLCK